MQSVLALYFFSFCILIVFSSCFFPAEIYNKLPGRAKGWIFRSSGPPSLAIKRAQTISYALGRLRHSPTGQGLASELNALAGSHTTRRLVQVAAVP